MHRFTSSRVEIATGILFYFSEIWFHLRGKPWDKYDKLREPDFKFWTSQLKCTPCSNLRHLLGTLTLLLGCIGGIAWAIDHVFTVVIAPVKHLTLPFKFDHKKLSIYLAWNPKTSQIHAISVHFQKETYLPRAFCALGTTAPRWLLGSSHGSNLRVQMGARVLLDNDGTTASARKALKIAGKIEH